MRWFKHMTNSADDEKIARLIDLRGYEGYGHWWRLLEIIAAQMDGSGKTSVEYSLKFWSGLAKVSTRKWSNFLQTTSKLELIELQVTGELWKVSVRNLLRYRDEYTKKRAKCPDKLRTNSGQTPDKLRSKNQMQNQIQKKKKEESGAVAPHPPEGSQSTPKKKAKKTKKKSKTPRKKADSDHHRFIDEFTKIYQKYHDGSRPTWKGKNSKLVKDLLSVHSLEELLKRLGIFAAAHESQKFGAEDFDMSSFYSHIDKWVKKSAGGTSMEEQLRRAGVNV